MTNVVELLGSVAEAMGCEFIYRRKSEANIDTDKASFPLIVLLEIETPGFSIGNYANWKPYFPVNIQFFSGRDVELDSKADDRLLGHDTAMTMAKDFLLKVDAADYFDDLPNRIPGVILNHYYSVRASGYEINITLTAREPMSICQ